MKKTSRRAFVKDLGLAASGLMLGPAVPRLARAQSAPADPRRFLFAYFEGGWDQLLCLDPRDPATTNPTTHGIDPAYGQTAVGARGIRSVGPMSFGPAVPDSFLRYADRLSLVRGINMDTAAHEVGRRFFITGQFPQGLSAVGSSVAADVASQLGDHSTIPHLSVAVEAYASGLPSYARPLSVNAYSDLTVALTPFADIEPAVLSAVQAFHDAPPSCTATRLNRDGLVTQLRESQARSKVYLEGALAQIFDIQRTDAEMQAHRARYMLDGVQSASDPRVLGFSAGRALATGVSQVVSVRVAQNLDTHSGWAAGHPPALEQGFAVLTAIMDDLAQTPGPDGSSLLDHTTIVAFSEFARTPLFNSIGGRDHFLGNACLVGGPGLVRGQLIGGSADVGMMPVDLEPTTGLARPDATPAMRESGEVIALGPDHILGSVLKSVGAPTSRLRDAYLPALLSS